MYIWPSQILHAFIGDTALRRTAPAQPSTRLRSGVCCTSKGGQNDLGPRRSQRRGPILATLVRWPSYRWSYPAMSRRCCPVPPRDGNGRGYSSTARMPLLLRAFLDLSPLRSRAAILQSTVPSLSPAGTAAPSQPPPSAKSGRALRSSRPPASLPRAMRTEARDGSIFPSSRLCAENAAMSFRNNTEHCASCLLCSARQVSGQAFASALSDLWPMGPCSPVRRALVGS
jgi:hypothetical protein